MKLLVVIASLLAAVQAKTSIGARALPPTSLNFHPNGDFSKCVGIVGGVYADGTPVDIYDCNQSVTQEWQWVGDSLVSTNPSDNSQWCLDSGVQSTWTDGLRMKIWTCFPNLPQQTWTPDTSSGTIKLMADNFCLDLTDGIKTNRNVLQIWTCFPGNVNQIWTVSTQINVPPPGLFCCPPVGPNGLPLLTQQTGPFNIFCQYGTNEECIYNPATGQGGTMPGCPTQAPANPHPPTCP